MNEKRGKNNTWDLLKLEKVVIVFVKFKTELIFQPKHWIFKNNEQTNKLYIWVPWFVWSRQATEIHISRAPI